MDHNCQMVFLNMEIGSSQNGLLLYLTEEVLELYLVCIPTGRWR